MAAQTIRQVVMNSASGAHFWIDVTFDDVTIRVTGLAWENTGRPATVTLSQPGKTTITRQVAAFGVAPVGQEAPAAGTVNVPTAAGGYTYDPTGDNMNAAQLSAQWAT